MSYNFVIGLLLEGGHSVEQVIWSYHLPYLIK